MKARVYNAPGILIFDAADDPLRHHDEVSVQVSRSGYKGQISTYTG